MMLFGIEWYYLITALCLVWMIGSALIMAWLIAGAPIDPPWGK